MLNHSVTKIAEPKQLDQVLEHDRLIAAREAFEVGEQLETFADEQKIGQLGELRTISKVFARARITLVHVVAVYEDGSTSRLQLAHEHSD